MSRQPIKVRLTRISSTHDKLRTGAVEGETNWLPELHSSVLIFAKPLTEGAELRAVRTTPIKKIDKVSEGKWVFDTLNSRYMLEVL